MRVSRRKKKPQDGARDMLIWQTWELVEADNPDISTEALIMRVYDITGKSYGAVVSAMSRHPDAKDTPQ